MTPGAVALSGGIVQQWVRPTHVIAWRPVNGDDKSVSSVRVSFDNNVFLAANYPRLSLEAKPTHQGIFLHTPGSSAVNPDFASARGNAESAWLAVTDGDVKTSGDERLSLSPNQTNRTKLHYLHTSTPTPKTIPDPHPTGTHCLSQVPLSGPLL